MDLNQITSLAHVMDVKESEQLALLSSVLRRLAAAGMTPEKAKQASEDGTWSGIVLEHVEAYFADRNEFYHRYFADEQFRREVQGSIIDYMKGAS